MPESIQAVIGSLLRAHDWKLALAETCTGGLISDRITNVPGSSDFFAGAEIAYSYDSITALLGIPQDFLLEHTTVSEITTRALARAVRERLSADIALATTGIMGPGGAKPDKPVGLVYIALSAPANESCVMHIFNGDRVENKKQAADAALHFLAKILNPKLDFLKDSTASTSVISND